MKDNKKIVTTLKDFKENLNISDVSDSGKLYTKDEVIKMLNEVGHLSFVDGLKVGKSGGKVSSSNFTVAEWIENNL